MAAVKAAARKAAFARRKPLFDGANAAQAGYLSEVLAGYRGVPLSGFLPIRTEIDPRPAMAEAAAHGPVGVPVIMGAAQPLRFSRWTPDTPLVDGAFGAQIPAAEDFFDPEIVIVPLLAFNRTGGRLGYGGGFMTARWNSCVSGGRPWRSVLPLRAKRLTICRLNPPTSRLI